jgi:hypothetical protein
VKPGVEHPSAPSPLWISNLPSVHRLRKRPPLVDRVRWLERQASSRKVIHLGFLDADRVDDKLESGAWLHERLSRQASHLVGVDVDAAGVEAVRRSGYEAYVCDLEDAAATQSLGLEPAELIVAGELIEHLESPGRFLDAVRPLVGPEGRLILTTPNATALTNVLVGLSRREWSSPHHVAYYSWRTLATLLERHGWSMEDVLFYYRGTRSGPEAASRPFLAAAFNAYERAIRPVLRAVPTVSDGLIVVSRLAVDATPASAH